MVREVRWALVLGFLGSAVVQTWFAQAHSQRVGRLGRTGGQGDTPRQGVIFHDPPRKTTVPPNNPLGAGAPSPGAAAG